MKLGCHSIMPFPSPCYAHVARFSWMKLLLLSLWGFFSAYIQDILDNYSPSLVSGYTGRTVILLASPRYSRNEKSWKT